MKQRSVLLNDYIARHVAALSTTTTTTTTNTIPPNASSPALTDPSLSKTVYGKILDSIPISISDDKFSQLHKVFMAVILSIQNQRAITKPHRSKNGVMLWV